MREHGRERLSRKRVGAGEKKEEKKSRPHAFANWLSQTGKLIKDEKAFSGAPQLSGSPYQVCVI